MLFLTAIAYAAVAACLLQLTPLAPPVVRVSLQGPVNPAPAIAPKAVTPANRHHHPRLPDRHEPTKTAGAPAVF